MEGIKISRNTKIFSGAILGVILVAILASSIYRYENQKFIRVVNTNIQTLSNTVNSYKRGLNENAQYLDKAFLGQYQTNFNTIIAELENDNSSFFNNSNGEQVINSEINRAKYYEYMVQFAQQVVSSKSNFEPLINIMNNGGKLTTEQITSIQKTLESLENSNALTQAMNAYNTMGTYIDMSIESPYAIKQKIENLSSNLAKLDFHKSENKNKVLYITNLF